MTVHPRLSVSALSSVTLDFAADLALWRATNTHSVGLFLDKLETAGFANAASALRRAGLRATSLAARGFVLHDPTTWPRRQRALVAALETTADVHAPCMFITSGTPGPFDWDAALDALREAIAPLAKRASELGVQLALEPSAPLRRDIGFVHSLADMVDVARELDIGVVVELSLCWSERRIESTLSTATDTFALVQLADYVVGTFATSERVVPGDGDIPLPRLLRALASGGYAGDFELEMLGPAIEAEGYEPAIVRAQTVVTDMLSEAFP